MNSVCTQRSFFLAVLVLVGSGRVDAEPAASAMGEASPRAAEAVRLVKDAAWYDRALTGLEPPYPLSFRFLEDQGAWFTPFNRPGAPSPYDLRGWH